MKTRYFTFRYLRGNGWMQLRLPVDSIEVDGIDTSDYPDFCDAYIDKARVNGRKATDWELDQLTHDGDLVYGEVWKAIL
jgi:hypothetical protein